MKSGIKYPRTVATRFKTEKTTSITIVGTFDEAMDVLRWVPLRLDITLKIWLSLRDPETDKKIDYQLPVLTLDRGKEARGIVEKLHRQSRLLTKEYNDVQAQLDRIEALLDKRK